jgi:hypothetical protein
MRLSRSKASDTDGGKPSGRAPIYVGRVRADSYEAAAHDPYVRALIARASKASIQRPD